MLWKKGCRGEMLRLYFKLWPKCRPTDSLLQQYDLKLNNENTIESVFIELVIPSGKNIIIGVIYRPPNNKIDEFENKIKLIKC
jgi:hypothetical protein